MSYDIFEYVNTRKECGARNPQELSHLGTHLFMPSATELFVQIEADIKGPVPKSRFRYIP